MKSQLPGNYYDDFVIGDVFKHASSKTIFESDNNLFCLLTMNHNPLHLNIEYANNSQHGRILVAGTLVFSLAVGLTVPDISFNAIANLEYESVRHLAPVFINDTICAETKILNKWKSSSKNDRGIVYVETTAYNQQKQAVLSFRRKVLIPIKH